MLPVAASVAMINTFNAVSPITFYVSLVLLAASIYLILSKWPQLRCLLSQLSAGEPPVPNGRIGSIAAGSFKGLLAGMMLLLL